MKLLNRAIIYYSIAALLSFTLMGALLYDSIRHNVLRQVSEALLTEKQIIEEQILHTDSLPDFSDIFNHKIEVTLYKNRLKPAQLFIDTLINDPVSGSLAEYRFLVYSNNTPNDRGFVIKTSQSMEEEKGLLYEILTMIIIAFALMLLLLIIIIYSISRNLWGSFYNTLNRIRNFDIKSESEFNPVKTHTTEFAQLNQVLRILTGKIRSDYVNLKEVTENASHEIQTPLAVIRIKIEQMLQAKDISNQLAENLISINQSVTKISRINQSLGLMSKIENNQYSVTQTISLNRKVAELLSQFTDFIQSKHLEIKFDNTREVLLEMNTDLVDILLANLLSNAVKHNIDFGWIAIRLNQQELIFQNTGKDPNISTELLFQRFKKVEQSSDSPGLGLAIIKKVADFYNMTVKYTYAENIHTLHISFN
jgi:signal transduction histidine kinase